MCCKRHQAEYHSAVFRESTSQQSLGGSYEQQSGSQRVVAEGVNLDVLLTTTGRAPFYRNPRSHAQRSLGGSHGQQQQLARGSRRRQPRSTADDIRPNIILQHSENPLLSGLWAAHTSGSHSYSQRVVTEDVNLDVLLTTSGWAPSCSNPRIHAQRSLGGSHEQQQQSARSSRRRQP
jgi:hypothetical protein